MIEVHLTAPFRIIRAESEYLRETAKREKSELGKANARKIVNHVFRILLALMWRWQSARTFTT